MVSVLDSRSKGPGLSPGQVIVLCSWARHLTLTVPVRPFGIVKVKTAIVPIERLERQKNRIQAIPCQGNIFYQESK